jgi:hypothetical protein
MKSLHRGLGLASLLFVLTLCAGVWAAPQSKGLIGEWDMKLNFDGQQMTSILSFAKDKEGELTAQWVSIMGISEVKDIKREGKDITFTLISQFGDQEFTSNFIGTLEKGGLSGLLSSDQGEITTEGKKLNRMPRILGIWNMTIKMGEREFNTVLVVTPDKQKKLQAEWRSEWGEHEITEVQFEDGKLTFSRVSKFGDREWETTYEGTLKGHTLTGTFSSQQGQIPANGKRVGAALVGKWDLTMTSEQGTRKQRLTVLPDLSARFGSVPIKKIGLEEGQVSFEMTLQFGDNEYEIGFKGKLDTGKLTGKLNTSQGISEVNGTKIKPIRQKK